MNILDYTNKVRFKRRKRSHVIDEIIIHHSWTRTLDGMVSALRSKDCGTHYAIGREGEVYHLTPDAYRVAHCVEHNERAIGIDIIRRRGQEISACQYDALNDLLVYLVDVHGMKCPILHEHHIYYHRDLRATECPGPIDDSKILF